MLPVRCHVRVWFTVPSCLSRGGGWSELQAASRVKVVHSVAITELNHTSTKISWEGVRCIF